MKAGRSWARYSLPSAPMTSVIEDELADLLYLYIPNPPDAQRTIVAIASGEEKRIQYRQHDGPPGKVQEAVERVLDGKSTLTKEFRQQSL